MPSCGALRTVVGFYIHVVDDFAGIDTLEIQNVQLREIPLNIIAIIKNFCWEIASYSPMA